MGTILTIAICVLLLFALVFAFARSTAREANRITIEQNFRLDGLDALAESLEYFPGENIEEEIKLERKAARLKARAEEVASRQTPMWKAYSKTLRKRR